MHFLKKILDTVPLERSSMEKEMVPSEEETYKKSISMTLEGKQDSFHSLVFQWLTTCNRK